MMYNVYKKKLGLEKNLLGQTTIMLVVFWYVMRARSRESKEGRNQRRIPPLGKKIKIIWEMQHGNEKINRILGKQAHLRYISI